MIYVFEDRTERRRRHQDIVDRYKDKICFAQFDIDEGMNIEIYISENFPDPDIFFFHGSYTFKRPDINLNVIRAEMPSTRYVVFSGGIDGGQISENGKSVRINADIMYDNLEVFLKLGNQGKEISFEPLIWGEHYRVNRVLSLQDRLFREYFVNVDFEAAVDSDDIDDIIDDIILICMDYEADIETPVKNKIKRYTDGELTWGILLSIILTQLNKLTE